jgi:hypothetical protein
MAEAIGFLIWGLGIAALLRWGEMADKRDSK